MEVDDKGSQDRQTNKTWLGSSISDICKGKGPWSFSITPVNVSKYHAVLYNLPVTLVSPPKPYRNSQPQHWDEDHVRMPYSDKNLFPVTENGEDIIKPRWDIIKEVLSKPIKNSRELEAAIMKYNSSLPQFLALHYFFEEVLNEDEAEFFFNNILPKIIKLALQLPEIVPGSFPLLKRNRNRSVSLSQLQIASLLANAFLCTFPWKKDVASSYPGVNFLRLYAAHAKPKRHSSVSEKIKCILHYFRRVTDKNPVGALTFERRHIPKGNMPRWDTCKSYLENTKIHVNSSGTIEDDGPGFLQVDFANKNVGGGVLGYGCVQEEIRFVICPELIISRLFVEQLGDHEAIVVTGAERYSKYSGYGDTFKWNGNMNDETPMDEYGRRRTTISIIDATHFNKPSDQFYPSAILRELNKAYVGFKSREKENLAPVATGNWGCGAFRGSCELKSLIQLIACSVSGRDLVYFSFGNETLRDELYNMYIFLVNNKVPVAQLWRFLCGFSTLALTQKDLYAYIQQAFFDTKKQPTIKKFFNAKKTENEALASSESSRINVTSKKVNDNRSKESSNGKQSTSASTETIIDSDEDIIPATPPDVTAVKFDNANSKFKLSAQGVSKKMPKTDIIELIEILDGNANRSNERDKEGSFLMEIDKLPKKSRNCELSESKHCTMDEKMDIDSNSITDEAVALLGSALVDNKASKKKITDYFQIKASKSS